MLGDLTFSSLPKKLTKALKAIRAWKLRSFAHNLFDTGPQQVTLSFLASLNLTENNLSDQKLIDKLFRRFIRADARDWTNVTKRDMLATEEENGRKNFSEFTLNGR